MYAYISSSSKLFLQSSHSCLYPTKISSFSSPEDKPSCWPKVLQTVLCKHWILMLALLFNGTHLLLWLWIISFPICFQMYHFQRGYLCWSNLYQAHPLDHKNVFDFSSQVQKLMAVVLAGLLGRRTHGALGFNSGQLTKTQSLNK